MKPTEMNKAAMSAELVINNDHQPDTAGLLPERQTACKHGYRRPENIKK